MTPWLKGNNVELAIKNQGAIIIFQVHHHDFRGKQILITFSKALIKFAIDMLYYYFFWPKTPSRNNKLLKNQVAIKKFFFWARNFFKSNSLLNSIRALLKVKGAQTEKAAIQITKSKDHNFQKKYLAKASILYQNPFKKWLLNKLTKGTPLQLLGFAIINHFQELQ